jgi:hypothetical protein
LAAVVYLDIPDFQSGNEVLISSDLAAIVACLALITVALSYRFLPNNYARKSMYVVSFFMFASRVPVFVLANKDICFSDVQCWIPQRLMSTLWIWSCAFFGAFYQRYLMQALILGGVFVFFSFGVMGEYSAFAGKSYVGAGCLMVSLLLSALWYVFRIMRRGAHKTSAEIACEHKDEMDEVWAVIKETSDGKCLTDLSPPLNHQSDLFRLLLFKKSVRDSLDVSKEDQIQSLVRVWETPQKHVLVKQEYTDIKRLFQEAEYCNGAFQVHLASHCLCKF